MDTPLPAMLILVRLPCRVYVIFRMTGQSSDVVRHTLVFSRNALPRFLCSLSWLFTVIL